jgi:hypothetical protein
MPQLPSRTLRSLTHCVLHCTAQAAAALQGRRGLARLALLPGMKALQLLAVFSQARMLLVHKRLQ